MTLETGTRPGHCHGGLKLHVPLYAASMPERPRDSNSILVTVLATAAELERRKPKAVPYAMGRQKRRS